MGRGARLFSKQALLNQIRGFRCPHATPSRSIYRRIAHFLVLRIGEPSNHFHLTGNACLPLEGRTNAWSVNLIQSPQTVRAPFAASGSKGLRKPLSLGAKGINSSATSFAQTGTYRRECKSSATGNAILLIAGHERTLFRRTDTMDRVSRLGCYGNRGRSVLRHVNDRCGLGRGIVAVKEAESEGSG